MVKPTIIQVPASTRFRSSERRRPCRNPSTKYRRPLKLVYFEKYNTLGEVRVREKALKQVKAGWHKKDRSADLLHALRYERALAYEDLGQKSRARAEFEKLYAETPDFEDVAERLGL